MLASVLTDPRMLKTDALWAVYWAMFQCGQALAQSLTEADASEDHFTGELAAYMKRGLSDFGVDRIRQFGYPPARSYVGVFQFV